MYFDVSLKKVKNGFARQHHESKQNVTIFLELYTIFKESNLTFNDFVESICYYTFQEIACCLSKEFLNMGFEASIFCETKKKPCFFHILSQIVLHEGLFTNI
jgi:hypothetical protein